MGRFAAKHAIVAAGVLAIVGLMSSAGLGAPLSAMAGPSSAGAADTMQVRWRGHGGGGAGVAAGLMTGLIIGGLLAGPHYYEEPVYPYGYYAPPGPVGAPDWEAYCFSRYRSFDPVSGTYLGYDGRRHYCQ
jgi:hypothetical protein